MKKKTKFIIISLFCMLLIASVTVAVQFNLVFDNDIDDVEEPATIPNKPPEAKFTYSNDLYVVTFMDQSSDVDNDILSYFWGFGDGIASIEQNPVHTYDCSDTNSFNVVLTIDDGESTDTHKEGLLFGSHLNILDYSQVWTWDDIFYEEWCVYDPVWTGDISMTVENTGNMPAEISYARIETIEKSGDFPLHQGSIRFSFTYIYYEIIEGGGGNGLGSELVMEFISNNTLTISPGETVTLTSNRELTDLTWPSGSYPVRVWLYEKERGMDISHTMHETVLELV